MEPTLTIIRSPDHILDLIDYIKHFDYICYDIETTGVTKEDEIIGYSICAEEDQAFYVVLAEFDPTTKALKYFNDNMPATMELHEILKGKSLVCHNGLFDCSMAAARLGVNIIDSLYFDTMVAAHLIDENRSIGLKQLSKELLGEDSVKESEEMKKSVIQNGGSTTKDKMEMWKADGQLLAMYGAKDALLTYKLFCLFVQQLVDEKLDEFFFEESMPLLRGPTFELNTTGLAINTTALRELKKQLEAECAEDMHFINNEIRAKIQKKYPGTNKKNTFNIESNQQLAWLLHSELGLPYERLTDGGREVARTLGLSCYTAAERRQFFAMCLGPERIIQPEATVNGKKIKAKKLKEPWHYIAVDKRALSEFAPKFEWIKRLLDYKRRQKLLNTYVCGIEEKVKYGVLQPNFLQTGTTSGRYSCKNPNFQNLPREDKRIKSCIIARPGKVFVGADYSQLEPRVFAYYSGDARLKAAFEGEDDFYSVIGMGVFGKTDCIPRKEGSPDAFGVKYKTLRNLSKVIALASTYGATANQLAPTTGKSREATQEDIDNYFEAFPGVKNMMKEAHKLAKTQGYVENLFGRRRRMPDATKIDKIYGNKYHSEYPYAARSQLNLAVNHRIQSTGASIVNRAAIALNKTCKEYNIQCKLVLQVHDSLVVECDESDAELVSALTQDAMENTTILPGIKLEAVPKIGKNLSEV